MKTTRSRRMLFIFLITMLAALAYYLLIPHEPIYQGRPLSSWLNQLNDGDKNLGVALLDWQVARSPQQDQAAQAIRQIGTNALPYLLRTLTNLHKPLSEKAKEFVTQHGWVKLHGPRPPNPRRGAALAFDVLGPVAKPALPELVRALNTGQQDVPKEAAIALAAVGPEGRDALVAAASSTNLWTSMCAIWGLGSHHIAVPASFLELLMNHITNNAYADAGMSAWTLAKLDPDHQRAARILISGLSSTLQGTRWGSANALGELGTNALSAVPALLNAAQNSDPNTAAQAKRALKYIQPAAK